MEFAVRKGPPWPVLGSMQLEACSIWEGGVRGGRGCRWMRKHTRILTASQGGQLMAVGLLIPYHHIIMVDCLGVSPQGGGGLARQGILEYLCSCFQGKTIVLMIERGNPMERRWRERMARRTFYLRHGFISANIFVLGARGAMELMTYGGSIALKDYLQLQKYIQGPVLFQQFKFPILHLLTTRGGEGRE